MHYNTLDRTGCRYGRWIALSFHSRDKTSTYWNCICDCGTMRVVKGASLTSGESLSCGCGKVYAKKHGMAGTPTYKSWHSMIQRSQGKGGHESYVARGIQVCMEWMEFENFYNDMGERPAGCTLDRIDNTKGYSKENCRWATHKQQSRNRANTLYVTVEGKKMSFTEACEKYKIGISCARHRLRKGMSHDACFLMPIDKTKYNKRTAA